MNLHPLLRSCRLLLLALCACTITKAQDTTRITLHEAEKQFLSNNLQLLATRYNTDIAQAAVIQAHLYNNPSLQVSSALYNQARRKWLDASNATGQYEIGIQQLVTLAGKRNKQVKLAELHTQQAAYGFYDLMRTLRYTLRADFYNAWYLQRSVSAYNEQISTLENLNSAYTSLEAKGLVTLKDAVRIKSLLYSLRAEQTGLQNQLNDVQAELQLLLQNNKTWFLVQADSAALPGYSNEKFTLQSLVDSAYNNRYDLKLASNEIAISQQNHALQKALRVPDLTLGAGFDKRGSYINNASFLNAAIDLPFFNRNQGNIKAAAITTEQNKLLLELQQQTVENEVQKAYTKMITTQRILQSFDPGFNARFQELMDGVTSNFLKRNISLVDFTDFVESYKNNVLQWNQLQNERMQAIEALNFSVGKPIIE
jgi:outer membrane protein, heavy metal efflux system